MKIFLSAVSSQFKVCRDALASDLRAVGAEVVVQEVFQQHGRSLLEKLEQYIVSCDRVIALVGDGYGWEPDDTARPAGRPRRSYTQWEYFFACGERLDGSLQPHKDLYVYLASNEFLAGNPVEQEADATQRQSAFLTEVRPSGKDYNEFKSLDQLRALVLRDGFRLQVRGPRPRNLPYASLGSLFKGREDFLDDIHQRFQRSPARAVVIHALGGVGKTRLVIEYALRHEAEYTALLSVTADSPQALNRNLAALCAPQVLNLPEREAKEEEVQVAAALRWLDQNPGWLLILDNVDTPEAARAVEDLLPRLEGGQVLATSRVSDWSGSVEPLELPFLSEPAAVAFVLERTEGRRRAETADDTVAHALAKELDGLALALEQAGAFIWQKRCSLAEYLQRWQAREKKVRTWHDERLMRYPRSVAVTWDTTFEQLDSPAQALLRLLAWFAPEPVPRALLETEAARQALADGAARLQGVAVNAGKGDMEDALAALAGFSLLKWETGNQAFRIHRLVQEASREQLAADERAGWLQLALAIVNAYLPADPPPEDVRSWPLWEPMHAHVAALVSAADRLGIPNPTSRLMNDLGAYLMQRCVWGEAESLYRRALAIDEASLGLDNPNVAIRLSNLAVLLQTTNRLSEAEPLMRRALAIDEASFGPNDPRVATVLNNLGPLLQATNRLAEAESLMRRALAIDEASFGPEHSNVAIRLNNLASLLKATNRLLDAEPLTRRALAIDEHSFGPEHPNVATRLNNLAHLLDETNRLAEAEPLMRRALAIDEQSLGPEHPNVAIRLNNLASLLKATNRLLDAEPLMRRALAIDEQSFGPQHPDVARDLNNLATLLQATNRLLDAEPLMRRALAIDEHSFGPQHPSVAIRLNNLAQLLKATSRLAEAEPLMRRHLEIFLRFTVATGHEHPKLHLAIGNYAALLERMGRSPEEVRAQLDAIFESFDVRSGG